MPACSQAIRPFNDMRYFLDLKQLELLGWKDLIRWL